MVAAPDDRQDLLLLAFGNGFAHQHHTLLPVKRFRGHFGHVHCLADLARLTQASSAIAAMVAPVATAISFDIWAKLSLALTSARFWGMNMICLPSRPTRNKVGGRFPVPLMQYSA